MKHIFAPWRMAYIQSSQEPQGCIFCDFPPENNDEKRLILARGNTCFVIFNAYPYNPGHLMVAPYRHTAEYEKLTEEEMLELHLLSGKCISVLKKVMAPQGFNLGINLGKVAGAGIDGHLHMHIVPRWNGDTNFMSSVGGIRVVAEALDATYKKMKEMWDD